MRLRTQSTLASSGEAVAKAADGRVVFVEGAAPDETVMVEISLDSKKLMKGHVLEVIEPGAERVKPECDYYGVCGGCVSQHVSAAAQLRSKVKSVQDALRRIGHFAPDSYEMPEAWSGASYGYRARARFSVAPGGVVGFRRRSTRAVVDVPLCVVLDPALQRALERVRVIAQPVKIVEEIKAVSADDKALVRLPNKLLKLDDDAQGDERVAVIRGRSRKHLTVKDGFGALAVAPGVFAQSNPKGNGALVKYVHELVSADAPHRQVLELYAGSGNLTRVLVSHAEALIAVEGDASAVRLARKILGPDVLVEQAPVEQALMNAAKAGEQPSLVVANPPRSGFSKPAARSLRALGPQSMVYVSCDPATLARDVPRLGMRPVSVRVFDLYPQTAHVEVVAHLVRSSA